MTKGNGTIYKTFAGEVKGVDTEAGTIDMLIPMNTASIDRDGEIVEPRGDRKSLPTFMKRPILVSSHNYFDLRKQIGEFVKLRITDEGLMAKGIKYYANEGNEEADWAFNLASKGMAAFSIGFIPQTWEKIDEDKETDWQNRRYTEWELLEISQVVVPSNRDAIQGVRAKAAEANDTVTVAVMDKLAAEVEAETKLLAPVIDKDMPAEVVLKPYPNEHACRLKSPGQYDTCRRTKRTAGEWPGEGKEYIVIMCKKEDGPMEEQSYRYDKDIWTKGLAKMHCNAHDGKFEAASEEGKGLAEDIANAPVVDLTGEENEEHENKPKEYTQAQLADDLDYLVQNITQVGINEDNAEVAMTLASEIIGRLPGADIPVDIQAKVGAVLNAKNKDRLKQIQALAQAVLDSADKPADGDKQLEKEETEPRIGPGEVTEIANAVVTRLKGKRIPK